MDPYNQSYLPLISELEQRLLTEARTAKWKLEMYEFSYNASIRSINYTKTTLDFLSISIAIIFLFLQYLVKDKNIYAHEWLGYIGTALSIIVILLAMWGMLFHWKEQIEKKQELSKRARSLITQHLKLTEVRPLDEKKIRAWIIDCSIFEEERKHVLGAVSRLSLIRAFQHVGNTYPTSGLVCSMCGKEWTANSNKLARWSWIPFFGCQNCGV